MRFAILLFLLGWPAAAATWRFQVPRDGEVGLVVTAESLGSNWAKPGGEAAVLTLEVDGEHSQDITLFMGGTRHEYRVLLGPLRAGRHTLRYERNLRYSSAEATHLRVSFEIQMIDDPDIRHAPCLYLRPEAAETYSDVPLLGFYEWVTMPQGRTLQFSVIFSNEDGGTATDALYARWGRTADIEHLYRWRPDSAEFQGQDHKETAFTGQKWGDHPLLHTVTTNNNFAQEGDFPLRVCLWPVRVDFSGSPRERLLDEFPWITRIVAEELEREGKAEKFGAPRGFAYLDARIRAADAAASFSIDGYHGDQGDPRLRINRDGWIRTAIRMPAGKVSGVTFHCNPARQPKPGATCTIEEVGKVFFLGEDFKPQESVFRWKGPAQTLQPGQNVKLVRQE